MWRRNACRREFAVSPNGAYLDTAAEVDFDDGDMLARRPCDTPIALIRLVTEKRQWFKAVPGPSVCETPTEQRRGQRAGCHARLNGKGWGHDWIGSLGTGGVAKSYDPSGFRVEFRAPIALIEYGGDSGTLG
jgi:hypothetical protein